MEPFRTSAPKYDSRASLTAKVETLLSTVSFGIVGVAGRAGMVG